jgi:hypothetical protein
MRLQLQATTTTLPENVVAYLEEIQAEKIQSTELGKKVLETNERWNNKDNFIPRSSTRI